VCVDFSVLVEPRAFLAHGAGTFRPLSQFKLVHGTPQGSPPRTLRRKERPAAPSLAAGLFCMRGTTRPSCSFRECMAPSKGTGCPRGGAHNQGPLLPPVVSGPQKIDRAGKRVIEMKAKVSKPLPKRPGWPIGLPRRIDLILSEPPARPWKVVRHQSPISSKGALADLHVSRRDLFGMP